MVSVTDKQENFTYATFNIFHVFKPVAYDLQICKI